MIELPDDIILNDITTVILDVSKTLSLETVPVNDIVFKTMLGYWFRMDNMFKVKIASATRQIFPIDINLNDTANLGRFIWQ